MGRAFEYRKARKLKRWGSMSRTFTRIGKEITMAVKAGLSRPNSQLSFCGALTSNAKAANMPKDTVERAIKKATDKDASDYKEVIYEALRSWRYRSARRDRYRQHHSHCGQPPHSLQQKRRYTRQQRFSGIYVHPQVLLPR